MAAHQFDGIARDGADHRFDEENVMNRKWMFAAFLSMAISPFALGQAQPSNAAQSSNAQPANPAQVGIQREVRHELLMLPYFGVFDNIAFQVQGSTVTLLGDVTRPTIKSDAENSVKHIEGVTQVVNKINVLPPSPMDDRTRIALFHAIYGFPSMEKYALGVQKPIRIIVNSGHVTLEGVVDTQADKDTANIRANSVPGIFSVTNNLNVVPQ